MATTPWPPAAQMEISPRDPGPRAATAYAREELIAELGSAIAVTREAAKAADYLYRRAFPDTEAQPSEGSQGNQDDQDLEAAA